MKMKNKLLFIFLLFVFAATAQDRQSLQGRVVNEGEGIGGLYVINKTTKTETRTDGSGNFSLPARAGDKLVVYSAGTDVREFAISAASFKEQPYLVSVQFKAYELEEVTINDSINSVSLGIVKKGSVPPTAAERRLKTAGQFRPIMLLGIIAGGMPLDPIINAITGKTKRLKKELAVERRMADLEKINNLYTEEQIVADLKVPAENVNGFIYYAIEDKDFAAAVKAKNDTLAKFLLGGLAVKYGELLNGEK
jgi:hypothetical protein